MRSLAAAALVALAPAAFAADAPVRKGIETAGNQVPAVV